MKTILFFVTLVLQTYAQSIVCYGDSLTADCGYAIYLGKWYSNAMVNVHAKPGAQSRQVLDIVTKKASSCDYAIVLCGVNDIDRPRGVIKNLKRIYAVLNERGARYVIAISLTPWSSYPTWTKKKQQNTFMVNDFILSRPQNVAFSINVYSSMFDGYPKKYTTDGLHFSKEGHKHIASKIKEIIDGTWSQR